MSLTSGEVRPKTERKRCAACCGGGVVPQTRNKNGQVKTWAKCSICDGRGHA